MKKRVTGIGGIFFKTKDPEATKQWYKKHLGFDIDAWGCSFREEGKGNNALLQWSPFPKNTDYFSPSAADFMINYKVENLRELLKELKKEGVEVLDKVEEYDYGKFGWIIDLDGRKIELWQPLDNATL